MTTFSQVIDRTRRRLMTTQREGINTLAATVDTTATSWSFDHSIRFVDNSRLSTGLEDVYVTSVTPGSNSAQVVRGAYGSDPASHTQGDQVHINPTWSNWDIAQAVNDELVDLSSPANGLFRIGHTDLTFQSSRSGYDLAATDFLDVWRVAYDHPGPETDWPLVRHWRLDQDADTTDFPSGRALIVYEGGYPGHTIRVAYRATFDALTTIGDDVEAVSGLHPEAHDILSLGAAIRLLSGLEAQRAYMTTQPDPRRAEDVPPGTAVRAIAPLAVQREQRVNAEKSRLALRYPEML